MLKTKQKNAPRKPAVTAVTPADLVIVTGGDSGKAKIKETVVAD